MNLNTTNIFGLEILEFIFVQKCNSGKKDNLHDETHLFLVYLTHFKPISHWQYLGRPPNIIYIQWLSDTIPQ